MNRTILTAGAAIGLASMHMPAHAAPTAIVLDNGKPVAFVPRQPGATAPAAIPAKLQTIHANFARLYPQGLYNASMGASLEGPNTLHGQIWLAAAFTPVQNATVKQLDVAAGVISGTNKINVALYADASGVPGTSLWSTDTAMPPFATCCSVVSVTDSAGIPVTAGMRYWLVLTTTADSTDTTAAWSLVVRNQVKGGLAAQNRGSGWQARPSTPAFAFAVYGD